MHDVHGPWTLRHVAANGARFRLAEMGAGPLVRFLHGFPEFWWAWRHQLPAVAAAGYHAVAMDLRGYGGSDKTPNGYDPLTLSADVAGVVRTLGRREAVLVGTAGAGTSPGPRPPATPTACRPSPPSRRHIPTSCSDLPQVHADDPGCCTYWPCRPRGCRSAGSCEATTSRATSRVGPRSDPA